MTSRHRRMTTETCLTYIRKCACNIFLVTLAVTTAAIPGAYSQTSTPCGENSGCFPAKKNLLEDIDKYPARTVSASSTCGEDTTKTNIYWSLEPSQTNHTCNSAEVQLKNVYDGAATGGDFSTYWQSANMVNVTGANPNPQFVIFNFTDEFLLIQIEIQFVAPNTQGVSAVPAALAIQKMDSISKDWVTLRYFAANCTKSFPGIAIDSKDAINDLNANITYCRPIDPNVDPLNILNYSPTFDSNEVDLYNNMAVTARLSMSAIRIYVTEPASRVPLRSYVAIADVFLEGLCKCFGHSNSCSGPNGATCDCDHNTMGQKCDVCQPLYNNRPWLLGNTTNAGECLECTCNGHAHDCVYDAAKGVGVCVNCTDNTSGDRCDTCTSGFYLNPRRGAVSNTTSEPFCLACNCNQNGTLSTDISSCDVTTGQCKCKDHVTQRDCSECNDTYWGLAGDNLLGCNACACNTSGTVNGTNVCDKVTGTCKCKQNVEGAACNQCKNLTFNYDSTNPLGCTSCDCDPGASRQLSCDTKTGQCSCYDDLLGRDCRSPRPGYFVPRLDYIIVEPENNATTNVVLRSGHGTPGSTVSGTGLVKISSVNQSQVTFTALFSGSMEAVVRYEKITNESSVSLVLSLTSSGGYTCNGNTIANGQSWTLGSSTSAGNIRAGLSVGKVCLNKGTSYTAVISTSGPAMLVDSLVFIPDESSFTGLSDRMDMSNITSCIQMARGTVRSNRDICAKIEYSLMAYLLKGAVACSCVSGALANIANNQCDSFNGDCPCLNGLLPPDCSKCKADYYQISLTIGCTACGCHQNGSLSDLCDSNGNCSCRPNVIGAKCDACQPEYFGLHTKNGCTQCTCNPNYSFNNICNDYGDCPCKPGVKGPLCESCMNGFYNLTVNGCTQCSCNLDGSTGKACDATSGTCECLSSVEGSTCNTCKKGTYGLGKWNPNGCIPCFCWGHGNVCSSADGWYSETITSVWPSSSDVWSALDTEGNNISVKIVPAGNQYAMNIDPSQLNTSDIYFVAPEKFLGDHKSSYGRNILIVLYPFDVGFNTQVHLSGVYTNYTLVCSHNGSINNSSLKESTIQIPILEQLFEVKTKVVTTSTNTNITTTSFVSSGNASYHQLLETLSNLSAFYIKAYTVNSSQAFNLLSVTLEGGTTSATMSSPPINNVEKCVCEPGYTGSSCQYCAAGYTRFSPNTTHPGSQCVPCQCNGHGITACDQFVMNCSNHTVKPCDPLTGVCTCQHNTMGDHCQFCKTGYYGNAVQGNPDDCLPCQCPGSIVAPDINVFANSCSLIGGQQVCDNCTTGHRGNKCHVCSDGYFGTPENITNFSGKCQPCECNGRADMCDGRTGKCVACRNNTDGHNCEICGPGYYGDPMTFGCQPCACANITGSTGLCDNVTGQCQCLPNVTGPNCTSCDDLSFNLADKIGCQLCECSTDGSTNTSCDKISGQCTCRSLVTGRKCDKCEDGYWNVSSHGCDACSCNISGTAKFDNGTVQPSCDVVTGQCNCAIPGIIGRTCDTCSAVSRSVFQYVNQFYLGVFPKCLLCGHCFDSWGEKIDIIGKFFHETDLKADIIWSNFDNQTSDQVGKALTDIEDKINSTNVLLSKFETIANQLLELQKKFADAQSKQIDVSSEINSLTELAIGLSLDVGSLMSVTEMMVVSGNVTTSITNLRQNLTGILSAAEESSNQGESIYYHIQTLAFVVASPEEREKNLLNQANNYLKFAAQVNETYNNLKTLYETSLNPGANQRASALSSTLEKLNNITTVASEVGQIISSIMQDVNSVNSNVTSLVAESTKVREDMLDSVMRLQQHVINATVVQRAADKVLKDTLNYKKVAQKAEKTMRDSMTGLLDSINSLNQAETDLLNAQTQSLAVVLIQIPALADMQNLVQQIQNTNVSAEEVADLNLQVQQSLYDTNEAVKLSQKALAMARELNEEIQLMKTDIEDAKTLRNQVDTVLIATKDLNTTINNAIIEAASHSDQAAANVSAVTQLAKDALGEVTNITACITQLELDTYNDQIAASQVNDGAEKSQKNHLALLEVLKNINTQEAAAAIIPPLGNLTQADITVKEMRDDLILLEEFANMETLIQGLVAQDQAITKLDEEVMQLTADLDKIILALKESKGTTSCTNK